MSYAPPRPRISRKQRIAIFEAARGECYLCGGKIKVGDAWDVEHVLARELGGSDEPDNLRPAHAKCHRAKTAEDAALIAKSNRVRDKHRGFFKPKSRWPVRGFPKAEPQRRASSPIIRKAERTAT